MPNFRHRPEHKQGLIPGMGRMSDLDASRLSLIQEQGRMSDLDAARLGISLGLKKSKAKTIRPSFEPGGSRKKKKR